MATEQTTQQVNVNDFLIDTADILDTKKIKFEQFKTPWEVKAVTSEEWNQLNKKAQIKSRSKSGAIVASTDENKLNDLLIEHSVVTPDLQNATIQEHFGTVGDPAGTARAMLKPGQFGHLNQLIIEVNGLDDLSLDELVDEVKK
jgi:hypothetical protein